jgi:hypothetical protein
MLPVPQIPTENKLRCWLAISVIVGILRQRLEADQIAFLDRAAFNDLCHKTAAIAEHF